eukprot:Em0002g419a
MAPRRYDPEVYRWILRYWRRRTPVAIILSYLRLLHRVAVGATWLKKRMAELGLRRRLCSQTPIALVFAAIKIEIQTSNGLLGYRAMWRLLETKYGFSVQRSTVMMLLAIADPNGTAQRKQHKLQRRIYQNKGPNWCWHMDGYDKLKPFGFPIHACIDGFSRKILWLEVATTNNDPYVVAHFYLRAVLKLAGCPTLVRADCGTENVVAALCQMVLRHEHPDTNAGKYSFLFGSSIRNSRIESWWSQLRKSRNDWWINFFKTLVSDRLYDPDNLLQRHIAGFVFLPLLRKELDEFKKRWNRHKIRNNRLASCPNGAPDDLYYLSAYQGIGAENCTRMISPDCLARCIKKYKSP